MRTLIAFYSRADENYFGGQYRYVTVGNTEKVAQRIAQMTGAQLFHIQQKIPYATDYQTCIQQAQADLRRHARPQLAQPLSDLASYDAIFLGYPNYWGDLPMAVYTALESQDWKGKTIYPFCTHEGSGLSGTEDKIAAVCKGATVKPGLAILGSQADQCEEAVRRWLEQA